MAQTLLFGVTECIILFLKKINTSPQFVRVDTEIVFVFVIIKYYQSLQGYMFKAAVAVTVCNAIVMLINRLNFQSKHRSSKLGTGIFVSK